MTTDVQQRLHTSNLPAEETSQPFLNLGKSPSNSQPDQEDQRETLLSSLRGKTLHIPDLAPLFQHWPTKTNPLVDRLRVDVQEWLDR
jgi:hypothetical protein